MPIRFLLAAMLVLAGSAAEAETIRGRGHAVDGDTLLVRGQTVRLFGIDAPEQRQRCGAPAGSWKCGEAATRVLAAQLKRDPVRCERRDTDRYRRMVAVCHAGDRDLGAFLVSAGFALAFTRYSDLYLPQEVAAKAAGRGMWRGEFRPPWVWRQDRAAEMGSAVAP